MKARLWGGRFQGAQEAAFEAFQRSLPVDGRLLEEDVAASRAWARALRKAGVLAAAEQARLDRALAALVRRVAQDPSLLARSEAEDVHSFVEAELTRRLGALGRKLHAGRSRNDQVATDLRLFARKACARLDRRLRALMAELAAFAGRHAAVPLPGYTHLQRAQPVTFGHHALAYVEMLARDRARLAGAAQRLEECPLGSGALAGTGMAVDRAALARALGFPRASRNSLDAVSDRDFVAEILWCCALCAVHLSRLAEDWIFFASAEAAFVELSDAVCTGSSLMPHKKNPDGLELLRGRAATLLGRAAGFLAVLKGLPLAYNKDLQEDKEPLFAAADTLEGCLEVAGLVVRTAKVRAARCREAAQQGFLNATDLADLLVAEGVPFRDAHEQVGALVLLAARKGVELQELPVQEARAIAPRLEERMLRALDVDRVLAAKGAAGGTAPSRVRAEARRWTRKLGAEHRRRNRRP